MATITGTVAEVKPYKENAHVITWASMAGADTGTACEMPGSAIRSVQISGTFDAATVVVQGSNDGSNYVTLTDPQGNPISKTTASIEAIEEVTRYIRPSTSGGGVNSSITVSLLVVRRGN